jgi:hypothetical protein
MERRLKGGEEAHHHARISDGAAVDLGEAIQCGLTSLASLETVSIRSRGWRSVEVPVYLNSDERDQANEEKDLL